MVSVVATEYAHRLRMIELPEVKRGSRPSPQRWIAEKRFRMGIMFSAVGPPLVPSLTGSLHHQSKSITRSKARSRLVAQIRSYQPWKASPARRMYVPKSGRKLRPLGIPTVQDRAMQAIGKNAIEPEWEAHFEPARYGFRLGGSYHDAIAKIYNIVRPNKRKKWVLDADIEGAFDHSC
jgi:hypothetical protein